MVQEPLGPEEPQWAPRACSVPVRWAVVPPDGGSRVRPVSPLHRQWRRSRSGPRRSDRDGLTLLHQDLGQYTGIRSRDLGIDLVGRDLEDRLVPLDRVSHLLDPAGQRALGDRLAHLGHDHVYLGHANLRFGGSAGQ